MKTGFTHWIGMVAITWLMSGCVRQCASSTPTPLRHVTMRLNWTIYGEHAPFFIAKNLGYYKDAGLSVEITEGSGSATTVKIVGDGLADFGYASVDAVLRGLTRGIPTRIVGVFAQKNPQALIFRGDHPLKSLADIKNRRIGVTAGDANSQLFPALLYALNLDPDDVEQVLFHSPRAKEDALLSGSIDAFLGFYVDQPPRLEYQHGVDLDWLPLTGAGINTLSSSLIVSEKILQSDPELVSKFVGATQLGVQFMRQDPEVAGKILASSVKNLPAPLAIQLVKLANELHQTQASIGKPLGWVDADDWNQTLQMLRKYMNLNLTDDQGQAYTNAFLAEVL